MKTKINIGFFLRVFCIPFHEIKLTSMKGTAKATADTFSSHIYTLD
jgi:hypothetical protein